MDTLPVELRLKIFGLTLDRQASLVQAKDIPEDSTHIERVNVALFTVSRQISDEAQDAFYKVNTISIRSDVPAYSKLKSVRNLDFRSDRLALAAGKSAGFATHYAGAFNVLPHLRTITIVHGVFGTSTVRRKLLIKDDLYTAVKAHEIGVFELVPNTELRGKIWLKHPELLSAIAKARKVVSLYTIPEIDILLMSVPFGADISESVGSDETTLLASWLCCFEGMKAVERALPAASAFSDEERECVEAFMWGLSGRMGKLRTTPTLPELHEQLPDDVLLTDVSLEAGHSPELVEWADEILTLNWIQIVR